MNTKYTSITGFKDILPDAVHHWQRVEGICREIFKSYGYKEIRTPILEKTELFIRSIGETTDIVEKEMYTFMDRNGDSLTLRPEGTAPVVRAYIEHNIGIKEQIFKVYYMGPMFRHERPQKGRFRQFHQIGAEIFNVPSPSAEMELLLILNTILERLKVKGVTLQINSVGCPVCRPEFSKKLKSFLKSRVESLCENCKRRAETNPLRTLDCKNESCIRVLEDAPTISDFLCESCKSHFQILRSQIDSLGIKYAYNPKLMRGLDYYTKTAFEVITQEKGAQNAIAAGGRYDTLVEQSGGDPTPAVGFAIGIERLLSFADLNEFPEDIPALFIATVGVDSFTKSIQLARLLRTNGIYVETGYGDRSLKSQMRYADKIKARYVLILGEDEIKREKAILKNMASGKQEEISIENESEFFDILKKKLS